MTSAPPNAVLDRVRLPADLRALPASSLPEVADAVRAEMVASVSQTGGHLGAGLGVVELTVALHYVFDTPQDRIVWDVGHQTYPHKILTGRRDRMASLRQLGGLLPDLGVRRFPRTVAGAGDDLAGAVRRQPVAQQESEGQRDIQHGALHVADYAPIRLPVHAPRRYPLPCAGRP